MEPAARPKVAIATRAGAIWLVLICAEILHGIARAALLVPHVGEFQSSQIGVFTGSAIILVIALDRCDPDHGPAGRWPAVAGPDAGL